ncbi:MAG TPA: hypothetical protein VL361_02195 [Candidatus Limnocylindrales bacterium]|jgi:hypothetical protein|nr:hypothetical protein [Candidatus Limnocylindrales bacterium]
MAEQQMYNFVTISRFPGNPGTADGTNNAARFLNPSSMWSANGSAAIGSQRLLLGLWAIWHKARNRLDVLLIVAEIKRVK